MKTASGKEITITAGVRLPISDYAKVQEIAKRRGMKMAKVLREWICEGLVAQAQEVQTDGR